MPMHALPRTLRASVVVALTVPTLAVAAVSPAQAATNTVIKVTPASGLQSATTQGVEGDAPTGFGTGSIRAAATTAGAKSEFSFSAVQLFGRDEVTMDEIASISYRTKMGTAHSGANPQDWSLVLYTEPYAGDLSTATWYGDRYGAEPYFSANLDDPADMWNTWSTDGATNTLRFYESTAGAPGATFGAYDDPHWDAFKDGSSLGSTSERGTREFSGITVSTGSGWANGFQGQLDGLVITLTDGSTATVNFEPDGAACTTTCYVDAANGNDANGGASADDAKKTIQAAVDAVQEGGTVHVAAGTYTAGASITKPLTLDGAGSGSTVIQGSNSGKGLRIGNVSDVEVSDLTVRDFEDGVYVGPAPVSGISLTDVASLSNQRHGVMVEAFDAAGVSLTRVDSSENGTPGSGGRGLWVINGEKTGISVLDGTFNSNALVGIDISDGSVTGLRITGNEVRGNGDAGISVFGVQGPGENQVSGNTLDNNGRYGIEVKNATGNGATTGGGSVVVSDNMVSRTTAATDLRDHAGISVIRRGPQPQTADQPSGVVVTGNDVSGFRSNATGSTGEGFGIVVEGTGHVVDHNTVDNNDVGIQVQAGNTANVQGTPYFDRGDAHTSSALVNRNGITANTVGLRNVGDQTTDATCNWWGSADGPGGEVPGATTDPWLRSANLDGPCGAVPPTIDVTTQPRVNEGSSAWFTIRLSERPTEPVTVRYSTEDGTATTSWSAIGGADYTARSGSVTFRPNGPLSRTVTVPTRNDSADESDETFELRLSDAQGGELGTAVAEKTITDNDGAPRITIGDVSVAEGNPSNNSITTDMRFTVRLSAVSAKDVSASWSTRNGTAVGGTSGGDFVSASGTVTIPAGSRQATLVVTIRKDRQRERNEELGVQLSSLVNARAGDLFARGTIRNDD